MSQEPEIKPTAPETTDKPQTSPADKPGKKPVVVYIMILFIAAFLLMALSFFMHQRSNSEVLGELQNSVTTMQEVQREQEKIMELQEELASMQEELTALQEEADQQQSAAQANQEADAAAMEALTSLYRLQQEYSARHYENCQEIIEEMERSGAPSLLPQDVGSGITPPGRALSGAESRRGGSSVSLHNWQRPV